MWLGGVVHKDGGTKGQRSLGFHFELVEADMSIGYVGGTGDCAV